jgi:hypothetical protein
MTDIAHGFLITSWWYITVFVTGLVLTSGVALACRVFKWAPINITVNVNRHAGDQGE